MRCAERCEQDRDRRERFWRHASAKGTRKDNSSNLPDFRHLRRRPRRVLHPRNLTSGRILAPCLARAQTQFSCEFSALCFKEHNFLLVESKNQLAELKQIHFMSFNIIFGATLSRGRTFSGYHHLWNVYGFPGCGAARSGAPLIPVRYMLRAWKGPDSAAHHCTLRCAGTR